MRAYLAHVLILGAGTALLLPDSGDHRVWLGRIAGLRTLHTNSSGLVKNAFISHRRLSPGIDRILDSAVSAAPCGSGETVITIAYLSNQFPSALEPYVMEEIRRPATRGVPGNSHAAHENRSKVCGARLDRKNPYACRSSTSG